jgi:hypothetical protein
MAPPAYDLFDRSDALRPREAYGLLLRLDTGDTAREAGSEVCWLPEFELNLRWKLYGICGLLRLAERRCGLVDSDWGLGSAVTSSWLF